MGEKHLDYQLISHPHQTLQEHLERVDKVSKAALDAKRLSKSFFSDFVNEETLRRWMVYFHDFGKATAFFQYRIIGAVKRENPEMEGLNEYAKNYIQTFSQRSDFREIEQKIAKSELRGHAMIGAFVGQYTLPDRLSPLQRVQLIEVIKRHHGNLQNIELAEQSTEGQEWILEQQWAVTDLIEYRKISDPLGYIIPVDIHEVIADYDGGFFDEVEDMLPTPTIRPYLQTLFLFSLLLAGDKGDLMLAGGAEVGKVRSMPFDLVDRYKNHKFGAIDDTGINLLREDVYRVVEASVMENPTRGFYSITLPTGLGKTLTAYNAALKLQMLMQRQYEADGAVCTPRIIYCLPFTSVIDQNAAILEEILAIGELGEGLLAKHHYLADWPSKIEEQYSQDELAHSQREYLVEGWEYTLTVTTFVQFLESIFSNRNRKLRKFHNLANAIVILDEVQSIPPKYFQAVTTLLEEIHRQMDTRFILVTATQPFLFPNGNQVLELVNGSRVSAQQVFQQMNRISLDLKRWLHGPEELELQLEGFLQDMEEAPDASFLFIFNYVKESQQAYRFFADYCKRTDTSLIYLSAAIVPFERKRRIKLIQERGRQGLRTVVVSTQVVEAGVDIDLDIVYRAFAPLDSINQSAGRCNRNGGRGQSGGSVRLFKQPKRNTSIYDQTFLKITEQVLLDALSSSAQTHISESAFYDLNQHYAAQVRLQVAEDNDASLTIIDDMKNLRFEGVDKKFKLIEERYTRYGVFIEDAEKLPGSVEVWRAYEEILRSDLGRWERKQAMRQLRSSLLEYVVQFPQGYLSDLQEQEAEDKPFIRLAADEYPVCYDFNFGYFKSQADSKLIQL